MQLPAPRPHPRSDHFDGTHFFNPGVDTDKTAADLLRWRRTGHRALWPAHRDNLPYPPAPSRIDAGEVAVTFIGHASALIRTADCTILVDPVFSERVSPISFLGPKRVRPPGLSIDQLPPIDLVLLTHNHYDHMDLPSLRALRTRPSPLGKRVPIVTGLGNGAYLARKGISGAAELDWWQAIELRPGVTITFVPAQHWSSRSLSDRRQTLWGGFMIESGASRIYVAGDSGYCGWFSEIRRRLGAPDVALLPIGAYEPRWFMQSQHMNPAEAVRAHQDLQARHSIGMHFGTVQLTDEPIDEPLLALGQARAEAGLNIDDFTTLDVGETRVIPPR
ncbi:MBL fold metallo-hydrolase [Lichenihabitans sp. PAMC28606]|uniref:MBL fold metallo-hydrolase n=1 Tax=Lichenihabitans sp. PAMC28606 TaxID=2880932 RepID=UPI001D0B5E6D|nr:MBL fold metallo-hydrolase [Lichenihabitans sp. PAMC28606]UDL93652.1 MBL fold metallo-hydrolase [Lichenihabitans sp. PAMC28606]